MSQQLTISSLFSAFALVALALFARAGDPSANVAKTPGYSEIVQAEAPSGFEA